VDNRTRRNKGNLYTKEQVRRVLAGSGIEVQTELDSDFIIFCPFHNNHRSPAGEINKDSGIFFCFSCQKTSDLVEFTMFTSGRTYFESVRFIKSKEQETDLEQEMTRQLHTRQEYVPYDELQVKKLHLQAMDSPRASTYFNGRKINKESMIKFGLGFSANFDMVTVPVHSPDGILLGFVGRSIEGKEFKNTPGLPKSKTLFNINRVKTADQVYVVESSFDAIRLDQVGLAAVATLGANVSSMQIELLQKYFNNIIVIADNDEAGGNMKKKLLDKLGSRVSVIQLDNKYKDIGDMSDEDIKSLDSKFDNTIANMLK
jgi:DNA primase